MNINDIFGLLNSFASDPLFVDKFALAFGIIITPEQYLTALTSLPEIEVRTNAELQGALGAFSAQTGKIYLSESLIQGSISQYQATVIEEIGHYLDYYFNGNNDSDGDEGDIFSRLVRGETIDQTTLQGLKAENDHATITLDGQVIEVEQVALPLTNNNGFTIKGITAGDQLGFSVSDAGDVNGDGLQDIIIGAFAAPGGAFSGVSYVIFGSNQVFSNGFDLSTLNGTNGFAINGSDSFGFSGYSVSSAGDIDNDGKGDLVIGSPFANQSHVIFGNTTFAPVLNTSNLGNNGFSVTSSETNNIFGTSVSSAGDVNNDGFDDLIFGAPWSDFNGTDSGSAYILYGRSKNDFLNDRNTVGNPIPISSNILKGIAAGDNFGNSVSEVGDFNNDGIADIIIGAPLASPNGNTNAGQSFLLFGNANFTYPDLNTLNGTNGIIFNGVTANGQSGYTVSKAGDVNNDNISDIIIGAPFEGAGKAYVIFGSNQGFSANFNLSSLNGTNGFVINGKTTGDGFGISVSSAGDVNADGIDDVIIGANTVDANGVDSGESYVIYGRSDPFPASVNVANLTNSEGFIIQGTNAGDQSGISVSGVGDFNGDKISDVVIGSYEADPNGTNSGQANVVFGEPSIPIDPNTGLYYRPGQLVVQFKAGVTEAEIQAIASANGAISVEKMVASGTSLANDYAQWRILNFNFSDDLLSIQSNLANNAQVEANIFNYFFTFDSSIPNDPRFPEQWALKNIGQNPFGGTEDADIDAPEAWCKQKGSKSVVVAVLDTGIDSNHEDLASNMWRNPGEIANNNMDDDGNGYVDDVDGYNFAGSGPPLDVSGHGTQVAGVIGAVGNNGIGISGVSQNVSLMRVKIGTSNTVLNGTQTGATITSIVNGMNYAINNGADIINASWSLDYPLLGNGPVIATGVVGTLRPAFRNASDNGVLVVTSAGNDNINIDAPNLNPPRIFLPAAFSTNVPIDPLDTVITNNVPDFNNVIVVSASDNNDALAPNSNFGNQSVDLAAPGQLIRTTGLGNTYPLISGTSMAAAHVSGAAALLLAENSGLTPAQIINALNSSADLIPSLSGKTSSTSSNNGRRLNVNNALMSVGPIGNRPPVVTTYIRYGSTPIPNTFPNASAGFPNAVFTDPDGDEMTYTATLEDGSPLPNWLIFSYDDTFNPDRITFSFGDGVPANLPYPGICVKLTATDCWGASVSQTFKIFDGGSGIIIDGYIAGATVFFDANKNGVLDSNEPFTLTDNQGLYQLDLDGFDTNNNGVLDPSEGTIVAQGGIDTHTGLPLTTPLSGVGGGGVITLLTTVVAELVDQGLTIEEANTALTNAFSIPLEVEIATFDPIAATNNNELGGVETFSAMVQVQNLITQTTGLIAGASGLDNGAIVAQVVNAIASQIQTNTTLNLTDVTQIETIINDSATGLGVDVSGLVTGASQVIAVANQKIEEAVTNLSTGELEEAFAKVQKVALGETTNDLEAAGAGTKPIAEVVNENTGTALTTQIAAARVLSANPTDITLSSSSVAEVKPIGTQVGTFSTVDPDTGETHTYTLVDGQGDTDNAQFTLVGNILKTAAVFDYETRTSYSIRVQSADGNGGLFQKALTINISNVNEINGTPGRDSLTGTPNDDIITGFQGNDTLRGNGGNDQFVYTSLTDAADTIKDFTVGEDKIVLTQLLRGLGYSGSNPIADGYVQFTAQGSNSSFLRIDADGFAGSSPARPFIFVENVPLAALNVASNFVF